MFNYFKLFLVAIFWGTGYSITTNSNYVAKMLWNLTSIAVQSRQFPNYHPFQENAYGSNYPLSTRYPLPNQVGNLPSIESVMEVLDSIAINDDLRCVAKLLCEITAGTITTNSRQSSVLPLNVDINSLIELLSNLEGPRPSPLILYGRAVALGYTSKGNSESCTYAYPRCPSNPDVLIDYLNNHKGGFFRFFNGINSVKKIQSQISNPYKYQHKAYPEKRILHNPNSFGVNDGSVKGIRFPIETDYDNYINNKFNFPLDTQQDFYNYLDGENYRGQKSLSFPEDNDKYVDVSIYEKPLPNHRATPMIFPDRTGTGELLLDTDKLKFVF